MTTDPDLRTAIAGEFAAQMSRSLPHVDLHGALERDGPRICAAAWRLADMLLASEAREPGGPRELRPWCPACGTFCLPTQGALSPCCGAALERRPWPAMPADPTFGGVFEAATSEALATAYPAETPRPQPPPDLAGMRKALLLARDRLAVLAEGPEPLAALGTATDLSALTDSRDCIAHALALLDAAAPAGG
jgi:hypothetical protein